MCGTSSVISGYHGGEYEEHSLLKYCAEQPRTSTTTFRWCLLPPSAGDKYLPTDEYSKHIRNVGLRLRDCTAHYARRLSSSCGALPEIPISPHKMVKTKMFTLCDILHISWKRQVIIPNVRALSLWLIIKEWWSRIVTLCFQCIVHFLATLPLVVFGKGL